MRFLLTLLFACAVHAQHGTPDPSRPWRTTGTSSSEVPAELVDVGIQEKLGTQLNLSLLFKDETGQEVALGKYFTSGKPVFLSLVYYECPSLCNFHLNGVTDAFKNMDWKLGQQFEMVVVSIDSKETHEVAAKKKASYIQALGDENAAKGWHFLTGSEESIKALAAQMGFGYKWDESTKQWAHSSAMYAVSPAGVVTRLLYGIQFEPQNVKLALMEAANGKVGTVIDRLVLYCFQYDPNKKTYAFYAWNIMKIGGGLSAVAILSFLIPLWMRERKKSRMVQGVSA